MSESLFDREVKPQRQFRLSNRFDTTSVIHNGKHYFLNDAEMLSNGRTAIQVVYKDYKWKQDTHYIPSQLFNEMMDYRYKTKN